MIYMLSYILLVIEGVILEKSTNVKGRHIFLIISYLQLTLILGLRAQSVGIDTESYIAYFKLVSLGISGWMEPGITGISKVILLLGGNQQLLQSYIMGNIRNAISYNCVNCVCMYSYKKIKN